ncbi:O-Antigen ligase [Bradyrhizobium arachidis]|uniref:O-antigen ligase domain-containing protein n=1 Tax=Bradyrhizobium arachidis TaxID=858423 RepID=A0AAE7NJ88_9BRAD|nr:O-antigen ligase domain-containing protein [Bradyrhizobium arachidis]SFV13785.1 O-Antigen ligase [Bradyrhizobium arachidis]
MSGRSQIRAERQAAAAEEQTAAAIEIPLSERLATYALGLVIAAVPLIFGSVQNNVLAVWVTLLAAIALHCVWRHVCGLAVLAGFAVVICCWLLVVTLQLIPLPPSLAALAHPIWRESSALLGTEPTARISAVRDLPSIAAGAQIANTLALFCGICLGRSRWSAALLLEIFAWSGLFYAVYGIVSFLAAPDHVLWLEKVAYRNVLTTTFINANTAAVYLGASALAWLLLCARSLRLREVSRRHIIRALFERPSRRTLICSVAFFLTLSASFMTGSRLGTSTTLLVIAGGALSYYRVWVRSWRAAAMAVVAIVGAAVLLSSVLGGSVNARFDTGGLSGGGRAEAYRSTFEIIREYPLLGTGLGTFRWVFPEYRSREIPIGGVWDRAHSTPLELAAEMGLPFAGLIAAVWAAVMVALARAMVRRRRDRVFPVMAFWAGALGLLHSLLDFSLQIPGFSISIMVLLGIGLAQSSGASDRLSVP